MTIDFGYIKSYNSDRGFGFVDSTFSNPNSKVFFHIKKIKSKYPELAQKLDNDEDIETVNFWDEIEITKKGKQVSEVWLNTEDIPSSYTHQLNGFIEKLESIWKNIDSSKPSWLDLVTIELVGVDHKNKLNTQRDNLKRQQREAEEERQRVAEATRLEQIALQQERERKEVECQKQMRIAEENEIRRLSIEYDEYLEGLEAGNELHQLLEEMRPKNFTRSKQLSMYIVKHKLGYKYKHISGILRMQDGGDEWDFKGGFPTNIYRIICEELGLANEGTSARPKHFTPFKDVLPIDEF